MVGLERAAGSGVYDESVCQAGAQGPLTPQLHKLQASDPGPRSWGWVSSHSDGRQSECLGTMEEVGSCWWGKRDVSTGSIVLPWLIPRKDDTDGISCQVMEKNPRKQSQDWADRSRSADRRWQWDRLMGLLISCGDPRLFVSAGEGRARAGCYDYEESLGHLKPDCHPLISGVRFTRFGVENHSTSPPVGRGSSVTVTRLFWLAQSLVFLLIVYGFHSWSVLVVLKCN